MRYRVRFLAVAGIAVILGLGALWLLQRRLIYLPSGSPGPPPAGWAAVTFPTGDGVALGGWFHPPDAAAAIVIVFNGNAGNRGDRIGLGSRLAAEGLGVVLFDNRGYGGNRGSPSEEGLTADASAVVAWVAAHHTEHPIIFFGESLGAAVAIGLASEHAPAAMVLRSPFTSLADVASVHYPFLPVRLLLWDEYPSRDRIEAVAVPVVVIAGSADSIVPPEQSRAVHDAAPGPKTWILIDGADHNDWRLTEGDQVVAAVVELATKPPAPADTTTSAEPPQTSEEHTMLVTSTAFGDGGMIPVRYTCDGNDVSPPLALSDVPVDAVALVLVMDDPDAPGGTWDHWVAFDIPVTEAIAEDVGPLGVPGRNSWGRTGYGGPCPPSGTHRYIFQVFAVSGRLGLEPGATKAEVLDAVEPVELAEATLTGTYAR